jgi:hypothetical protein
MVIDPRYFHSKVWFNTPEICSKLDPQITRNFDHDEPSVCPHEHHELLLRQLRFCLDSLFLAGKKEKARMNSRRYLHFSSSVRVVRVKIRAISWIIANMKVRYALFGWLRAKDPVVILWVKFRALLRGGSSGEAVSSNRRFAPTGFWNNLRSLFGFGIVEFGIAAQVLRELYIEVQQE